MRWVLVDPYSANVVGCYHNKGLATAAALRKNRRNVGHPAYRLFELVGEKPKFHGRLWRPPGYDFDPKDCWKKG